MGREEADGAKLFVRYAYPPNQRGYCGPDDAGMFRGFTDGSAQDPTFVEYARAFTGAWPYLEVIADASGIADPLDRRVVEAYWIGSDLLGQVDSVALGRSMAERFRRSIGGQVSGVDDRVVSGGFPHHSFHVFCVYPWAGLLGHERMRGHALQVLDKCRVRPARIASITGGTVTVESAPLTFDGRRLEQGVRTYDVAVGSVDELDHLVVGDAVAVHWDWICDRLSESQVRALEAQTAHHLGLANERLVSAR